MCWRMKGNWRKVVVFETVYKYKKIKKINYCNKMLNNLAYRGIIKCDILLYP